MKNSYELSPKIKNDGQEPADTQAGKISHTKGKSSDTLYEEILRSVMEKKRSRVERYYCANLKCPTTFFSSDFGYECPDCRAFGVISKYKHIPARMPLDSTGQELVLGILDSIGRLFCPSCVQRFTLEDDASLVIYETMEPFCSDHCESCGKSLKKADHDLT
ncbi:MAG: hypothetical protein ACP5G0_06205 [Desulfomonilia bacterium]